MRVSGPDPDEAGHAFIVAHDAEALLDAVIEGRVTSVLVRALSESLCDLRQHTIGGGADFGERGDLLLRTDWLDAKHDADVNCIWVDVEDDEAKS